MENEKFEKLLSEASEGMHHITTELKNINENISEYDAKDLSKLNLSGLKEEIQRFLNLVEQ